MAVVGLSVDLSPVAIEVEAARALRDRWTSRGLPVAHNGTATSAAPGGREDVTAANEDAQINVELTKLLRVAQTNNEATSVPAHLDAVVTAHPARKCYALFVSPTTAERTITLFQHYNGTYRDEEGHKVAFMSFTTFNLFVDWLDSPDGQGFTVADFCRLLEELSRLGSDAEVLQHLNPDPPNARADSPVGTRKQVPF
jgi:hypothetical protein